MPKARASTNARSLNARIVIVRGSRVILDYDLAELYGVDTRSLNQAVSRNLARFPADFAFVLNSGEITNLISQSVISSLHGGRRTPPRAFTEQGVAMLSSVLRSRRAVSVNVAIMRAFVRLRELALTHAELTRRIEELEQKYDGRFAVIFKALRELSAAPPTVEPERRQIGFTAPRSRASQSRVVPSRP